MSFDTRITDRMRNRIQEVLVADGVPSGKALVEANSMCDGLGYYTHVDSSTGLRLHRGYDGIEVYGNNGDLIETIPFDRMQEFF